MKFDADTHPLNILRLLHRVLLFRCISLQDRTILETSATLELTLVPVSASTTLGITIRIRKDVNPSCTVDAWATAIDSSQKSSARDNAVNSKVKVLIITHQLCLTFFLFHQSLQTHNFRCM